ncbi:MAG TPA: hypothetical protein VFT49_00085 [Candidatus Saccharimonadales bacterium]|nr:hypothetical protein [Candidatus Saccharimonadales bacterium]
MSKDLIASIAGGISIIFATWAAVPYILSILRGRTKPHQMTWLVFSIMNGVVFLSQYLKGARASVLLYIVWFFSSTIIFLLSLKFGLRNTSRLDRTLFSLSLLTIVAWALTKNPSVAIWLTVFIDIFATSMMLLKIRAHPDSEEVFPWIIGTIAYIFTVISLINKSFGILYVRPIYGLISEAAIPIYILYLAKTGGQSNKKRPSGLNIQV